ncbi:MAG TPA: DUF1674 domain-containing protein [Steroidobacteraceae bacterium]|nr:DUF1674 domain-containing protein [Steroidobacteraceae bacterium]
MRHSDSNPSCAPPETPPPPQRVPPAAPRARPREIGGPSGPEPTRFGDWERKGRCIDF